MAFARHVLSAVLTAALAVYALDCAPMATAKQAMQCCKSMRCMSHHHQGEDCCKTMPSTHVEVGQPTSASIPFAYVALALLEPLIGFPTTTTTARITTEQSHAPPKVSPPDILPLRI